MTPEQREVTQRLRRRAFRTPDKATARNLLALADDVAGRRFAAPPRALLAQLRAEDPPMPDLDQRKRLAGRPPRVEPLFEATTGSSRFRLEADRKTGDLIVTLRGETMTLDEVQARLLRKAFALEAMGVRPGVKA